VRMVRVAGRDALMLATELLQRARLADPRLGLWEAADLQWRWRTPRRSDVVEQLFWIDGEGPVACVFLTGWTDEEWQCDPIIVPGGQGPELKVVWAHAVQEIGAHAVGRIEVPVDDDDLILKGLVEGSGLVAGERTTTAWLSAADRRPVRSPADGFVLVDRTQRTGTPHPMRHRNGDAVEQRLAQCPLYDPELDLAVETADGEVAGYSLYWLDPITKVGLVEPVRVEKAYQRRGLARAMLTEGIDRLAIKGALRVKISFRTEAAGALYQDVGFQPSSTDTSYGGRIEQLMLLSSD
jgi:ribosomal protein S18 acetylase RimI-like enzyme